MWPIFSRFPEQPVAFYFVSLRSKGLIRTVDIVDCVQDLGVTILQSDQWQWAVGPSTWHHYVSNACRSPKGMSNRRDAIGYLYY